jgi:hypothetical protein
MIGNSNSLRKVFTKYRVFADQASTKDTKVYYINLKNENYGRRLKNYVASAAGSVAVEGAEA